MKVHQGHLLRVLGKNSKLEKLSLGRLNKYVADRMKELSANGRTPGAATLKKELVTLRRIWSWGKKRELVPHELPALKGIALPKTDQRPPFQTWEEITRQIDLEQLEPEAEKELWNSLYLRTDQVRQQFEHVRENGLPPFLYPMFVTAGLPFGREFSGVITSLAARTKDVTDGIQDVSQTHLSGSSSGSNPTAA